MGIMDLIVETLNEQEEKRGSDARWEALHTEPVELVETPASVRHRDIKTGKFTREVYHGRQEQSQAEC